MTLSEAMRTTKIIPFGDFIYEIFSSTFYIKITTLHFLVKCVLFFQKGFFNECKHYLYDFLAQPVTLSYAFFSHLLIITTFSKTVLTIY